jgi:hypothetical protein
MAVRGNPEFNIVSEMKDQRGFVSSRRLHHNNNFLEACVGPRSA